MFVRNDANRPESGSMVRTFVSHVLPMTVDMLHGGSQPQLVLQQKLLTRHDQRYIRACLYPCEPRATGPAGPRKDSASIILESSAILFVWCQVSQHTQDAPQW